jgi:ABC-type multidrug transport system fused ATPase/permease subunit
VKKTLQNTWAVLTRKEKTEFTLLLMLDLLISILDILSLVLLFWIIQFYIDPNENANLSILPEWLADRKSIAFIAIFFFLFTLKNVAGFLITKAHYKFISKVTVRISETNMILYQQSSFTDFVNVDSSVFIRKIAYRPFEFGQYMLSGIQQIMTQVFLITAAVITILIFNAKLFLFLLVILLPPVIVVFYFIKKSLSKSRKQIQSSSERSFKYLFDALKGYVEGNVFGKNNFFLKRFIQAREQYSRHLFHSFSLQHLPNRVIEIFAVMGLFILIAIAKWTTDGGSTTDFLTIGAFMAAAYKIIPGMVKIINANGQIKAYEYAMNELMTEQTAGRSFNSPVVDSIHTLEFHQVHFSYSAQPMLSDINFKVTRNDFAGITGISGKGKTSILNLILGFLPAADGEILVNGSPVNDQQLRSLWPQLAYVRQQSFFIHDTVLRNITLEEENPDLQRLNAAVESSGLATMLADIPEGLQKIITENGKNISGGQQQRVAIARALYKNAPVLLLDEPFNELDEASEISLLHHLQKIASEGRIVVLITHSRKSLAYCNKIICLDEQQ